MELEIVLKSSSESNCLIFCPGESVRGNAILRLPERVPLKQVFIQLRGYEKLKRLWEKDRNEMNKENMSKEKSCRSQFSKDLMQQNLEYKSACILLQELILWDIENYAQQRESKRNATNSVVRRRARVDDEINQVQGVLLLPFQFQLPNGLPPTIRADSGDICIDYELCLIAELENNVLFKSDISDDGKNTRREKRCKLLISNDVSLLYKNSIFTKPHQEKAILVPKKEKKWFSRKTPEEVILKAGIPTVIYEETVGTLIPVTVALINQSMKTVSDINIRQMQLRRIGSPDGNYTQSIAYGPALYVNPNNKSLRKNKNKLGPFQSMLPLAVSLGPTVEGKYVQFTNLVHVEVVFEDRRSKIELNLPIVVIRGKKSPFLQRIQEIIP